MGRVHLLDCTLRDGGYVNDWQFGKRTIKGFGRKMVEAGIAELKAMGCDKMVIGCLAGNPSNSFYEHIGGKLIKTRIYERLQLPENVYFFERI